MATNVLALRSGAWRYSLRSLLIVLLGLSVILAVGRWNPAYCVATAFWLLGAVAVIGGVRGGRKGSIVAGVIAIAVGFVQLGLWAMTVVAWVGTHKLDVYVLVVDASTLAPIADATIEPLEGPSALEGRPPAEISLQSAYYRMACRQKPTHEDGHSSPTLSGRPGAMVRSSKPAMWTRDASGCVSPLQDT